MSNIPKQHEFNHESHIAKIHQRMKNTQNEEFSLTQQSCKQEIKLCIHLKTHIENIKARITMAFKVVMWSGKQTRAISKGN